MGLSLASIPLFLPSMDDPLLAESVRALDPADLYGGWDRPRFAGLSPSGINIQASAWKPPRIKLNCLRWPWGASRYATGCFLVSGDGASAIRDQAFGQNGLQAPQAMPLALSTPGLSSIESLIVQMHLAMPPIPLRRVPDGMGGYGAALGDGSSGVYLLPLVDQRYFFRWLGCPAFSPAVDGVSVQWLDLLNQIFASLGVEATIDSIDTAYRLPHPSLQQTDQPLMTVLDQICSNIGMRLVANYDGTFRVVDPATAQTLRQQDDASKNQRTLLGGGDWALSNI